MATARVFMILVVLFLGVLTPREARRVTTMRKVGWPEPNARTQCPKSVKVANSGFADGEGERPTDIVSYVNGPVAYRALSRGCVNLQTGSSFVEVRESR